jgi:hypothetical protein
VTDARNQAGLFEEAYRPCFGRVDHHGVPRAAIDDEGDHAVVTYRCPAVLAVVTIDGERRGCNDLNGHRLARGHRLASESDRHGSRHMFPGGEGVRLGMGGVGTHVAVS